ncbi:MAG TPA: septal ring lytic transglycosylase RlpA family protein [Treponemataceae bacterium]|nr:septal ring lytic transglycosylase RlpA family protein [Treponemataceae bacterium]
MRNTHHAGSATRKAFAIAIVLTGIFIAAPLAAESEIVKLEAMASWYGEEFNGRPTSSGEIFDMNAMTAAHKTLPFGTMLELTNLSNGKKALVRVNDRGPFVESRDIDVSKAAAQALGMIGTGTTKVSIRRIDALDAAAIQATQSPADSPATSPTPAADVAPATNPAPATSPAPATVAAPVLGDKSTGVTWRIQLGSFSREENAMRLVVKLRKDGFNPAFEKASGVTRVVLTSIDAASLATVKDRLSHAGYAEYVIRQESW